MITQKEIRDLATIYKVPKTTIDKDWVLGHVLYGIYQHPILSAQLIFKGGTCLRKCYFEDYRFSEDLDFTVRPDSPEIDITMIYETLESITKSKGIRFHIDEFIPMLFQDIKMGYKVIIKYWGADHPKNQIIPAPERWHSYIKLEMITHELMCFEPIDKCLLHNFSDAEEIASEIPCYTINEIICEKLRAMLQRKYTAPRDYYDTWYIINYSNELSWQEINNYVNLKMSYKNIRFTLVNDFFSPRHLKTLQSHWMPSLGHHISMDRLPSPETVIENLREHFTSNLAL